MARTIKNAATVAASTDPIAEMAATIAALQAKLASLSAAPAPKKAATPADGGAVWPGDGNAWSVVLPKGSKVVFKTFVDARDKTGMEHTVTLTEDKPVTITGYVSGVQWGKVPAKTMRKVKA